MFFQLRLLLGIQRKYRELGFTFISRESKRIRSFTHYNLWFSAPPLLLPKKGAEEWKNRNAQRKCDWQLLMIIQSLHSEEWQRVGEKVYEWFFFHFLINLIFYKIFCFTFCNVLIFWMWWHTGEWLMIDTYWSRVPRCVLG